MENKSQKCSKVCSKLTGLGGKTYELKKNEIKSKNIWSMFLDGLWDLYVYTDGHVQIDSASDRD